ALSAATTSAATGGRATQAADSSVRSRAERKVARRRSAALMPAAPGAATKWRPSAQAAGPGRSTAPATVEGLAVATDRRMHRSAAHDRSQQRWLARERALAGVRAG